VGRIAKSVALLLCVAGVAAVYGEEFTDDAKKESDAKLTRVCQAAIVWSIDNEAKLPEHVAQLIVDGVDAGSLVCKRVGGKAAEFTAEEIEAGKKDWKPIAAKLKGHCDFVFAFKGIKLREDRNDNKVIIGWEKIAGQKDGIIVASLGGRTRLVKLDEIKAQFEANNTAREENKFPLIEMKDDLPVAPE
jgi:hypothetical protein